MVDGSDPKSLAGSGFDLRRRCENFKHGAVAGKEKSASSQEEQLLFPNESQKRALNFLTEKILGTTLMIRVEKKPPSYQVGFAERRTKEQRGPQSSRNMTEHHAYQYMAYSSVVHPNIQITRCSPARKRASADSQIGPAIRSTPDFEIFPLTCRL